MRNLIITFTFLCVSLVALTLFAGVTKTKPKPVLKTISPYMFENEQVSIEKISLTVIYFIPKDATEKKYEGWKIATESHLKKLLDFHVLQFENTSKITYDLFPEIIIGEKTTSEYEKLLDYDNPDAVTIVKDELIKRAIVSKEDILQNKNNNGVRKVYLVVFEGNGGAGNDNFCLISRSYLTDNDYQETGSTFLAHEFYHTLGLVDNYTIAMYAYKDNEQFPVSLVTKKDIMGQVNIPLSRTYIDNSTLKKMGL